MITKQEFQAKLQNLGIDDTEAPLLSDLAAKRIADKFYDEIGADKASDFVETAGDDSNGKSIGAIFVLSTKNSDGEIDPDIAITFIKNINDPVDCPVDVALEEGVDDICSDVSGILRVADFVKKAGVYKAADFVSNTKNTEGNKDPTVAASYVSEFIQLHIDTTLIRFQPGDMIKNTEDPKVVAAFVSEHEDLKDWPGVIRAIYYIRNDNRWTSQNIISGFLNNTGLDSDNKSVAAKFFNEFKKVENNVAYRDYDIDTKASIFLENDVINSEIAYQFVKEAGGTNAGKFVKELSITDAVNFIKEAGVSSAGAFVKSLGGSTASEKVANYGSAIAGELVKLGYNSAPKISQGIFQINANTYLINK